MAAEDEAAGGVAVEPVRQSRRVRQAELQVMDIALEIVAAAWPGMAGEAGPPFSSS